VLNFTCLSILSRFHHLSKKPPYTDKAVEIVKEKVSQMGECGFKVGFNIVLLFMPPPAVGY